MTFTFAVLRAMAAKTGGHYPAPLAALDAIAKGCNLPLEDGLKAETEAFLPLVGSPISRNLIAVFFMTQRLQKDPGTADAAVKPRDVGQVGVVGAGIMGAGIAGANVRRGVPALLIDAVPAALEKGVAAVAKSLQGRVEIGRMTVPEATAALARLSSSLTVNALSDRDVVIEAIVENEAAKVKLYGEVEKLLPPGAMLASNTSTISITRMAKSVKAPERFAGMHFFNPVDRMHLVEVIRGEKTSDATVVTLVALAKRIGKTPIVVRDCPGFLVNRILFPYLNESLVMLEEGASPRGLDKAATAFGMPMGPVTLNDLVGLDTSLYAGRVINTAFADRAAQTRILDDLVAAGRLGQKTGAGFYAYAKPGRGADDPALAAPAGKAGQNAPRDRHGGDDGSLIPADANGGEPGAERRDRARAGRRGHGFDPGHRLPTVPRRHPAWADSVGLPNILAKLKKYEHLGARYEPTEQMRKLAAEGKGFYADA